MTDEEKDKTEKEYKEWLVNDHKLLDNPTYCDIEQKCFRAFFAGTRYGLAEGRKTNEDFIAGAKWGIANAIEWHDLRKDPSDLPSSKTLADISVLLAFKSAIDGEIVVEEHIYCNSKGFIPSRDYYQGDYREPPYFKKEGVLIAWCELPQYKDKG